MPPERRYKIVQAPTRIVLETIVREMERQGWIRVGEMALAKSTLDSQPPYWVQSISHPLLALGVPEFGHSPRWSAPGSPSRPGSGDAATV